MADEPLPLKGEEAEWKKTLQTLVDVPACPACTKIIEDIAAGKKGWVNAKDKRIAELEADAEHLRHLIAGDYIPKELRPDSDSPWENPVKLPEKDENP